MLEGLRLSNRRSFNSGGDDFALNLLPVGQSDILCVWIARGVYSPDRSPRNSGTNSLLKDSFARDRDCPLATLSQM